MKTAVQITPLAHHPVLLPLHTGDLSIDQACDVLQLCHEAYGAPRAFTDENRKALQNGDWRALSHFMFEDGFFGPDGTAAIISDYRVWRPGVKPQLSLLLCQKGNDVEDFPFDFPALDALYGPVTYTPVIPVHIIASSGNIAGADGELFIVPTAWKKMPELAKASPLLDIGAQILRMRQRTGRTHWQNLLDPALAQVIISLMNDDDAYRRAMYWEYSLHEYGHACGRFAENVAAISGKMAYAAFEEWRSDGLMAQAVRMHLEKGLISPADARNILISNFMTRFGVDITRRHEKLDHDFLATYFVLKGFLYSGKMTLAHNRLTAVTDDVTSVDFWLYLYEAHALRAEIATRMEEPLGCLDTLLPPCDTSLQEFQDFAQTRRQS